MYLEVKLLEENCKSCIHKSNCQKRGANDVFKKQTSFFLELGMHKQGYNRAA